MTEAGVLQKSRSQGRWPLFPNTVFTALWPTICTGFGRLDSMGEKWRPSAQGQATLDV